MSLLLLFSTLEAMESGVGSYDYSRLAATVERLLKRFGVAGQLERPTWTGPKHSPVPGPPLGFPAIFVVGNFSNREIDGTRILQTDKKVIIAPSIAITPQLSDLLNEGEPGRLKLMDVKTIRPATRTLAYIAQARR